MATEPTSESRRRRPRRLAARRAANPEAEWHTTRRSPEELTAGLPEGPIADASEQFVNRHVLAALGRLTQEHRDVLRECCFRGTSVAQAAHNLQIAPDMVKARAYYALRALQLAIEEVGSVQ